MPEFHHLDFHSIEGVNAEKRRTALSVLLRQADRLEKEITALKRLRPKEANKLVDELERLVEKMEGLAMDQNSSIDELERIIINDQENKPEAEFLPASVKIDTSLYGDIPHPPVISGPHIYFTAGRFPDGVFSLYDESGLLILANLPPPIGELIPFGSGQLAVLTGEGETACIYDLTGQKYQPIGGFEQLSPPFNLDGRLYYYRKKDNLWELVDNEGKVISNFKSTAMPEGSVKDNREIFTKCTRNKSKAVLDLSGGHLSMASDDVGSPKMLENDLCIPTQTWIDPDAGQDPLWYMLSIGSKGVMETYGAGYQKIGDPLKLNGRLYYRAYLQTERDGRKGWTINCENDDVLTRTYDDLSDPILCRNELLFPARVGADWTLIKNNKQFLSLFHEQIKRLQPWRNGYMYAAQDHGAWHIYGEVPGHAHCQITPPRGQFDSAITYIFDLHQEGDKIRLLAQKGSNFISLLLDFPDL